MQLAAVAFAPANYGYSTELSTKIIRDYTRTRAQTQATVELARVDLERGLNELDQIEGDSNIRRMRDQSRFQIAMELVPDQIDRAIELVKAFQDEGNRAQAFGRLAVKVAKHDKQKAIALIDDALKIHRRSRNAYSSWSNYGGAGPFAAALAYHAKEVGYPDMESVIWHVRAACRVYAPRYSAQDRLQTVVATARVLALTDQLAARDLLDSTKSKVDLLPRHDHGLSPYDQYLQAWLLVDFNRGTEFLSDDLKQLSEDGKQDPLRYGHGDVFRLLTCPVDEQYEVITSSKTGLWNFD